MEIKSLPVQNEDGGLVPGSSATVYHMDSGDLATIYDKDGAVISNPIVAGADGIIEFAAENGPYRVILTIGVQQYERFLYFSDIKEHNHSPSAHPELSAFITSEADRAEQAADAATASGNIYPDTAAGLAATTEGDYFSVPSPESAEYLILYRHDAGPAATEIKRYPSVEGIQNPLQINARISNFLQMSEIPDNGYRGAELNDGTPVPSLVFAIENGTLEVLSGQSDTVTRYWWFGHSKAAGSGVMATARFQRTSASSATRGIIAFGEGSETRQCVYASNGLIAISDAAGTTISSINAGSGAGGMTVAEGEWYQITVSCDESGSGYILAEREGGNSIVLPVSGIPDGIIRLGWRSSTTGAISNLIVRNSVADVDPAVSPLSWSQPNVLPGDLVSAPEIFPPSDYKLGWAATVPDAFAIVDFNGRKAIKLTSGAFLYQAPIAAGATKVAYTLLLDAIDAYTSYNTNLALRLAFISGSTTISSEFRYLQRGRPGEMISGVADIPAGVDSVLFRIGTVSGTGITFSYASLAFSDIAAFRAYAPSLSSRYGLYHLIGYSLVPDSVEGRTPRGFTCTGLDKITRGNYAGCWIVGDDGRLVDTDSSPYVPTVHVITPDWSTIIKTFPMPYSGASVQGVAVDTSGASDTFWVATAGDLKVRHFALYGGSAGGEITGDVIDWSAMGYDGNPNGLAYDSENQALWVGASAKTTRLISCDPEVAPRLLSTIELAASSPDQFYYDNADRTLYYTYASNGQNGAVRAYNIGLGTETVFAANMKYAQAIEGIYIDRDSETMTIVNDGGYHVAASPALNIALKYKVSW